MKISIITLFPQMFSGPFDYSIIKHAREKKLVEIEYINIRDYGIGKHNVVDDKPYGGGVGMILKVDILDKAITAARDKRLTIDEEKVIYLGAHGKQFSQEKAKELIVLKHIIFLCGHYEGIDERAKKYINEEISIGDYITTGGEIPAMIITDAITRLVPGVLKPDATKNESFTLQEEDANLLEFPHYTTPAEYKGMKVPDILLSGNHKEIEKWRMKKAVEITEKLRPDLLGERGKGKGEST